MENLFPFSSVPGAAAFSSSDLCLRAAPLVFPYPDDIYENYVSLLFLADVFSKILVNQGQGTFPSRHSLSLLALGPMYVCDPVIPLGPLVPALLLLLWCDSILLASLASAIDRCPRPQGHSLGAAPVVKRMGKKPQMDWGWGRGRGGL